MRRGYWWAWNSVRGTQHRPQQSVWWVLLVQCQKPAGLPVTRILEHFAKKETSSLAKKGHVFNSSKIHRPMLPSLQGRIAKQVLSKCPLSILRCGRGIQGGKNQEVKQQGHVPLLVRRSFCLLESLSEHWSHFPSVTFHSCFSLSVWH